jgi:hypothetical protein
MAGAKFLALLALVAFVFVALVPGTVVAWGADGHHSTCLLAEVSLCAVTNNFEFLIVTFFVHVCECVALS